MASLLFMSAHVASQQLGSWALVVGLHQLHVDRLLHVLKGLLDQRAHHVGLMRLVNRQIAPSMSTSSQGVAISARTAASAAFFSSWAAFFSPSLAFCFAYSSGLAKAKAKAKRARGRHA